MTTLQLSNKVILITGAAGTAGRSAVKLFLEKGATVAACDIKPAASLPSLTSLQEQYGKERLSYYEADLLLEEAVKSVLTDVRAVNGRLDGAYHNVYTNKPGAIATQSLAEWNANIHGTLTSTFLLIKYAAAAMIESGAGGAIVSTSSVLGTFPRLHNAGYGAGKAGLEQLTRVAAYEYAPYHIRVNAVVPGDFKPEDIPLQLSPEHYENMKNITLIGRSGTPNEINEVAAFLLSDAASYVTGSLYPVTGGILY